MVYVTLSYYVALVCSMFCAYPSQSAQVGESRWITVNHGESRWIPPGPEPSRYSPTAFARSFLGMWRLTCFLVTVHTVQSFAHKHHQTLQVVSIMASWWQFLLQASTRLSGDLRCQKKKRCIVSRRAAQAQCIIPSSQQHSIQHNFVPDDLRATVCCGLLQFAVPSFLFMLVQFCWSFSIAISGAGLSELKLLAELTNGSLVSRPRVFKLASRQLFSVNLSSLPNRNSANVVCGLASPCFVMFCWLAKTWSASNQFPLSIQQHSCTYEIHVIMWIFDVT